MSNKVLIDILNIGIKDKKKDAVCFKLPELSKIAVVSTKNKYAAAPVILSKYNASKFDTKYILSFNILQVNAECDFLQNTISAPSLIVRITITPFLLTEIV